MRDLRAPMIQEFYSPVQHSPHLSKALIIDLPDCGRTEISSNTWNPPQVLSLHKNQKYLLIRDMRSFQGYKSPGINISFFKQLHRIKNNFSPLVYSIYMVSVWYMCVASISLKETLVIWVTFCLLKIQRRKTFLSICLLMKFFSYPILAERVHISRLSYP